VQSAVKERVRLRAALDAGNGDFRPQVPAKVADLRVMDVSAIADLASRMSQDRLGQAVDVAVLKKAMQLQQESAMSLISAITPASSLPSHLGQNVNVVA
jgi:hypothetical protein